jgi:hypothetical protein
MNTRARAKAETLFASITAPAASGIKDSELPETKTTPNASGPNTLHLPKLSPAPDDEKTDAADAPVRVAMRGKRVWGTAL